MVKKTIIEADFYETGYCYTLSLISRKCKPYCLMEYEPLRFNEMLDSLLGRNPALRKSLEN